VSGAPLDLTGAFTWIGTLHGEFHGQLGSHRVEGLYATAYPEPNHMNQNCVSNPAGDGELVGPASVG
jgi:hypothetical protein